MGLVTLVERLNFQAVIKSAASAASLGTQKIPKKSMKNKKKIVFFSFLYRDSTQKVIQDHPSTLGLAGERPDDGGRWDDGDGRTTDRFGRRARGAPQAVGEAALAADLITA